MLFLKPVCVTYDLEHREPRCETSQNSQRRRTDPIWTQGIPLVHQRKTVPLTSPLYEEGNSPLQHSAEAGPPLLPGTDLESLLSSPSDRKPKVEKNNTQNDPPTPMGPVSRLRRDRPGSCSVDRGWGSQGCERPSCHFEGATSVSLGHEWSLLMLRRHVQPVGGDNQKSEEGRQRHPPGLPRRPSFHVTRSSSIGTLSGYKLPIMPSLAYYPIMPQLNPGGPQAPHSQKHLTPASSSCLQSLCPQGSAAQSHREDSRPPHCTSSSQMLPFPGPNPAAHMASRAWPQLSC